MIQAIFVVAFLLVAAEARTKHHELEGYTFDHYVVEFKRTYQTSDEASLRKGLFEKQMEKIRKHNQGTKSWKMGVNHYSDWTEEEMKVLRGSKPTQSQKPITNMVRMQYDMEHLESLTIDWREKNIITAVKNQGKCGSCWTFAAAETLESFWALETGELTALSEQQILDCTPNPKQCGGTGGCYGGTAELAYERIKEMGGLATEWTYPYVSYFAAPQTCHFDAANTKPYAKVKSHVTLPQNEYAPLLHHVATKGPIVISVDASAWSGYETGVFDGCNQTNPDIDHAVQLVGYGTDAVEGPYWLVRNSWSAHWGELGYIRLKRNAELRCGEDITPRDGDACKDGPPEVKVCGTCGILYDNSFPIVDMD